MRHMSRWASRQHARRARRRRSLTARALRARKKGGFARCFRLRRGQEGQGPQTAYPRRHIGSLAERRRSFPPTSRIATAPSNCYAGCDGCFPLSNASSPTAVTVAKRWLSSSRTRERGTWTSWKRSDAAKGFEVLPKCWIVERTLENEENSRPPRGTASRPPSKERRIH